MDDHGYRISEYQDVEPLSGALADLIRAWHQSGIELMMDLVVNHTSDEPPWFLGIPFQHIQFQARVVLVRQRPGRPEASPTRLGADELGISSPGPPGRGRDHDAALTD